MIENTNYAFPVVNDVDVHPGMTLRDYFAGQALQGEMAAQSEEYGSWSSMSDFHSLAWHCYRIADAMLAARQGKDGG